MSDERLDITPCYVRQNACFLTIDVAAMKESAHEMTALSLLPGHDDIMRLLTAAHVHASHDYVRIEPLLIFYIP